MCELNQIKTLRRQTGAHGNFDPQFFGHGGMAAHMAVTNIALLELVARTRGAVAS